MCNIWFPCHHTPKILRLQKWLVAQCKPKVRGRMNLISRDHLVKQNKHRSACLTQTLSLFLVIHCTLAPIYHRRAAALLSWTARKRLCRTPSGQQANWALQRDSRREAKQLVRLFRGQIGPPWTHIMCRGHHGEHTGRDRLWRSAKTQSLGFKNLMSPKSWQGACWWGVEAALSQVHLLLHKGGNPKCSP